MQNELKIALGATILYGCAPAEMTAVQSQLESMGYSPVQADCAIDALREHFSDNDIRLMGKSYKLEVDELRANGEEPSTLKSAEDRYSVASHFGSRISMLSGSGDSVVFRDVSDTDLKRFDAALKYGTTFHERCRHTFMTEASKELH